jgi:hypothetical protein
MRSTIEAARSASWSTARQASSHLLVVKIVLRGTWVSVTIAGAKVDVQGDMGRAVVDVVMSRSGKGTPLAQLVPEQASVHRFDCRLMREEDGWRATTVTWRPISLAEALAGPELPSAT